MINDAHFVQLQELMGEGLPTLIASYMQSGDSLLQEIGEAIASKDANKLMHAAHPLKSASRQIGANQLADFMEQLETSGKNNSLEGVEALYQQAQEEYTSVKTALQEKLLPL